jgi:hypothetical protein
MRHFRVMLDDGTGKSDGHLFATRRTRAAADIAKRRAERLVPWAVRVFIERIDSRDSPKKSVHPKTLPLLRGTLIELFRWRDIPDKPGWQRREAQLAVWCPFCKRFHFHGWDPADNASVKSHRVAHCADGPFRDGGYCVSVWRVTDPDHKSHVCRPGRPFLRKKDALT